MNNKVGKKNNMENINVNIIKNLQDDMWCIHKYLDSRIIPRRDECGEEYSVVGRIKQLENSFLQQMSAVEDFYLSKLK